MNIKETFLKLTSKTYPYGFEDELVSFLPKGYFRDEHGNYYYEIGESKTAFTCHLDTACKDQVDVVHIIEGDIIKTDGKSILGADDKAGMTVLLYMIENEVPGLYCFFIGEEVGCIGSGLASKDKGWENFDRMVSFDRRGTTSIITYQSSKRCCSDEFGKALASEFNSFGMSMTTDDTGVYTDSAEFTSVISECTNISVGYNKEHNFTESQNIKHLISLCEASVKVDWEKLPTKRKKETVEWKSYSSYSRYDYGNYDNGYRNSNHSKGYNNSNVKRWNQSNNKWDSIDEWYDQTYTTPKSNPKKNELAKYDDPHKDYAWCRCENCLKLGKGSIKKGKKGKVYYNSIDNEITDESFFVGEMKSPAYYEALKQIIYDDRLTATDFEKLKEQYLDMSDANDREFFEIMKSNL